MRSAAFTLAGLARAVGMDIDDVRFYRDSGLLQPPRRTRSRTDDSAFGAEHIERLNFIQRSLACGLTNEDIGKLFDSAALVTCGDVYAITGRRLAALRVSGRTAEADCLAQLYDACAGVGSRQECKILEGLSTPGY